MADKKDIRTFEGVPIRVFKPTARQRRQAREIEREVEEGAKRSDEIFRKGRAKLAQMSPEERSQIDDEELRSVRDFDDHRRLYRERYGTDEGPSFSPSCGGKNNPSECGCWTCHLLELREWKKSQ